MDWEQQLSGFLGELGLSSVDDHPVIRSLAEHVTQAASSNGDRAAFVADDGFETLVLDLVNLEAAAYDAAVSGGGPPAQGDPAMVAAQASSLFGLPALRGVAAAHPDLLARQDVARLATAVASVVAHRLIGKPLPDQDELTGALLAQVEGLLDGNPEVAAEFWTVFGSEQVDIAQQWITYHLSQLPGEIESLVPVDAPAPTATAYDLPTLVEATLRDVPDAVEVLTPEEINSIIAEVLAETAADSANQPSGS